MIFFIIRTAFIAAVLTVVYAETGWGTTLLLTLTMFRFETENILFSKAYKDYVNKENQ
jgi:hypothetical protein